MSTSSTPTGRPSGPSASRSAEPADPLLRAYHELWPEAERIRRAAYRCGGPRWARKATEYVGFGQLNAGRREVLSMAESLGPDVVRTPAAGYSRSAAASGDRPGRSRSSSAAASSAST
jgi:hypothetical protein